MTLPSSALSSPAWTRHHPPARQPATLERAELLQLLDDLVEQHPVTVVTAPSGFGKTTVVSAWAEKAPRVVAWLALDPLEGRSIDEAIVAALESVVPRHRSTAIDPFGLVSPTEQLDLRLRLDAAVSGVDDPVVLVIDDAQRAQTSLESGLLAGLLTQTPSMLRIVLVGTTALELRMPRFILSHPDAVIGAEALAFDAREVAELAAEMSSTADTAAVHADTAGWPIAVRLGLLSGSTPRSGGRTRELMREYVRDVILSALEPDLARFVVDAAVCDELTPRLAAELTGRSDAGRLLEQCRRLGLFLDRHDGPAGVEYKWHALFARHCRGLLGEEDPARLETMHRRAAVLLAEARPLDAVNHHLEVGETDAAASVILSTWVRLVVGNAAAGVDRACLSLPAAIAERPALQLVRACARDVLGEHKAARELFERAQSAASNADDETQRTLELARLFFVDERAKVAATIATARVRFESHPTSASEHAAIAFLLGWAELRQRASPDSVIETLQSATREAEAIGDRALARRSRECLAYALAWSGRFSEARPLVDALAHDDPDESSWVAYIGGSGAVAAGLLAYFANDLEAADHEFRRVIAFGGSRRTFTDLARVLLACVAGATGDARQCRRAALELQFLPLSEVQGIAWPKFRQAAVALLEEGVGHRDRAVQIARSLAEEQSMPIVALVMAGVLRRAGAYSDALQALRRQSAFAGVSYVRVATMATSALAHWTSGRTDAAHELFEEALAVAEGDLIRLPFADADPEMRELLSAHIAWGTQHEDFVLSCLRPALGSALGSLSERERDVFEQLRTTLTTIEIADRLGVSVNTVKTHQRSIYRKLGVTSRREALRQYT